jgi:RHS repeat-associated protein
VVKQLFPGSDYSLFGAAVSLLRSITYESCARSDLFIENLRFISYLNDGSNLLEELDSAGNVLARYSQSTNVDEPLSELRSSTSSYYQADGLGSITSLSNAAGVLANTYTYDSFGKLTASTGTLVNPFQYTSREFDNETGQHYYRSRYFDSTLGRFTSEDAVSFLGGINFYAYALNQPTNYIDPHGFAPEGKCGCSQGAPGGIEKAKKCCADTQPISADDPGPNPYSPCQTYMKVNAAGMYRWGGNGPWGQIVRGCLLCALQSGASMSDAHHYCYKRGLDRTGYWNGFTGFTRAVGGALLTVGLQLTYPNPNDPTLECLNVK